VKALAEKHGFQYSLIPMTNTHHATMFELVIGKDLSWMDMPSAVPESQQVSIISEPAQMPGHFRAGQKKESQKLI